MSSHPVGAVAVITWTRPTGEVASSVALRGEYLDTSQPFWLTTQAHVHDELVSKVVPQVRLDLTDLVALSQIVDDATRNAGPLTVAALAYALREHRTRTETHTPAVES